MQMRVTEAQKEMEKRLVEKFTGFLRERLPEQYMAEAVAKLSELLDMTAKSAGENLYLIDSFVGFLIDLLPAQSAKEAIKMFYGVLDLSEIAGLAGKQCRV